MLDNSAMRKILFINSECYHIFNRSIAKFQIFNNPKNYHRFVDLLNYYRFRDNLLSYSKYLTTSKANLAQNFSGETLVDIVAYCIMPTHFHILLKQNTKNGIVDYISKIENGYTKYFNTICKRKGPLWEGRFESVYIKTNDQLLHLTRYIHLNPSSANLVKKPEHWEYSSYNEYLDRENINGICAFDNLIDMTAKEYRKFTDDRIAYQKELSIIKSQLIDNYSG